MRPDKDNYWYGGWKNLKDSLENKMPFWKIQVGHCLQDEGENEFGYDLIEEGFHWHSTPQGHEYWRELAYGERPLTEHDLVFLQDMCEVDLGPVDIKDYL